MAALKLVVRIERKHAEMPAFVVVPATRLARWKLAATTTVEGTLDGVPLGRRSLKRWDDDRWFIELRSQLLGAVGKSPGDRATLRINRASAELPAELQKLIDTDPAACARWESRTEAQGGCCAKRSSPRSPPALASAAFAGLSLPWRCRRVLGSRG